jgi:hypothetical protein
MTNTTCNAPTGRWQAEVVTMYRCIPMEERTAWGDPVITYRKVPVGYVVLSRPCGDEIRFRVNLRKDRPISFTDPREAMTGAGGTAGVWGTRPEQRPGRCRSLTPSGFVAEVSRLIGTERAEEIVREVTREKI